MNLVELYGRVRFAVRIEGISRRVAARHFGIGDAQQLLNRIELICGPRVLGVPARLAD